MIQHEHLFCLLWTTLSFSLSCSFFFFFSIIILRDPPERIGSAGIKQLDGPAVVGRKTPFQGLKLN